MIKDRIKKLVKFGLNSYTTSLRKVGLKPESIADYNEQFWPDIDETDVQKVLEVLASGQLSIIPETGVIDEMRGRFQDYFSVKHAVPQNSGTSTLHSAYFALGLQPGDEVIVPSATFHASASPIYLTGAKPVFAEIDPTTLSLSVADLENRLTDRTKAVCLVHWYGVPGDVKAVQAFCKKHQLALIEDCSQAHGATVDGQLVGTYGDIGCYSLQKQKGIAAGEAGVLLTNSDAYYDRALVLGHFGLVSNRGATADYRDFTIAGAGHKYRIHPLAAALAITQLDKLSVKVEAIRRYFKKLDQALFNVEGIRLVNPAEGGERGAYHWGGAVLIDKLATASEFKRKKFIYEVNAAGVGVQWPTPMLHLDRRFADMVDFAHAMPPYPHKAVYKPGDLPITEALYPSIVIIQQHVENIDRAVLRTVDVLKAALRKL